MKRLLACLLFTPLVLISCNDKPAPDPKAEEDAVKTVLERYVIANETQDMDLVRQIWADDPDIVVFGTDSDERLVGWDAIQGAMEKQFRTFTDTYIAMTETEIRLNGVCNTAWFSSMINYTFTYRDKPVSYEGLRFTGVLNKIDGHWFIVQSHISVPSKPRNQMTVMKVQDVAEPLPGKGE